VDTAKGICIILVVLMHSTLGVEKAVGSESWLHQFILWARPFRMPDFFLISGLFLANRIAAPWRDYLDAKVVHFAYFYVLWMTIQFVVKAPSLYSEGSSLDVFWAYASGLVQPYASLWFIYLLAVFFLLVKALRPVSPPIVLALGAVLEILSIETGSVLVDEFAQRFIYFYSGYLFAPYVFAFARRMRTSPMVLVLPVLGLWVWLNSLMAASGLSTLPLIGLALGYLGSFAVVAIAVLVTRLKLGDVLRYCGEHSIAIYLAFILFMAPVRILLLKAGIIQDTGLMALAVTAAAIAGPLLMFRFCRVVRLNFLFARPAAFRLKPLPERAFVTS
jgi:uncharacterized membrane protein YcfT